MDALYIAATALNANQTYLNVISNNIANINTPAFKRSQVDFENLAYRPLDGNRQATAAGVVPGGVGEGVTVARTGESFQSGGLRLTNNPMDVAISGPGFFEVQTENGTPAYTRAGQLTIGKNGDLKTVGGYTLTGNIQVPPNAQKMTISPDGTVSATVAGQTQPQVLGHIELARFNNPEGLSATDNGLYRPTQNSGDAYYVQPGQGGAGTLRQGFLEQANVDLQNSMMNLILAQRAYQLNARVIQVADQVMGTVNNLRR